MAWNGSGTFSLNQDFIADRDAGAPDHVISAVKVMNELENIKSGLENCMTITGETSPSASITMNSQRLINLANATGDQDAVALSQVSGGTLNWAGTFGGTANALTATISGAPSTLPTGYQVRGVLASDNTSTVTLNVNAGGAIAIKRVDGSNMQAGDLRSGRPVTFTYMGSVANAFRVSDGLDPEGFGSPSYYLSTVGGTGDVITGTTSTGDFGAYSTGQIFSWVQSANNTTSVTLNVESAGAKAVVDVNGSALTADALVSGKTYLAQYDGTSMVLLQSTPMTANAFTDLTDVTISSAASDEVLYYNGTAWVNSATLPANIVATATIADDAVNFSKLLDATQPALVGASAAGAFQEITLGSDLSVTGNVLTSTVAPSRVLLAWYGAN